MEIGNSVEYVDASGNWHEAFVTAIHGGGDTPSVNLVYVSDDESQTDQYGRQIQRSTSVVHESNQGAHGNFWRAL